jgi:hypothetical protein
MCNKNHGKSTLILDSTKTCGAFGGANIGGRKAVQAVSPLFGAEQAEVGQWPYLLALSYRYRGFKYPPGILVGFSSR